jgi:hypothetical protein
MNKEAKATLERIRQWNGINASDVFLLMDRFRENPRTDEQDIVNMHEIVRDLGQGVWNHHIGWAEHIDVPACDAWQHYIVYHDHSRGYQIEDAGDCHFTPFLIENASASRLLDMWSRRIDEENWCEFDVYEEFETFPSALLREEIGTELWDALKATVYDNRPDLTLAPKLRDAMRRAIAKTDAERVAP